jgi:hypothetical protein
MRRYGVPIVVALLMSLVVGCGESGRQEGLPPEGVQSSQTSEFRKAMETAGNKMMKGQMGKKAAAPISKAPEKDQKEEKEKPSTP